MADLVFLDSLTQAFEKLPGVGKKTAERYAYSVIDKMTEEDVQTFANTLLNVKKNVCKCSICGMLTLNKVCEICSSNRSSEQIMVVKDTKDIIAIEKSGQYRGMYHALGGLISPLSGIGPDDLNIDNLENRLSNTKELIIATPFTQDGETTYLYIKNLFKEKDVSISRIGFGLPAGSEMNYIDDLTLRRAIENRTK